MSGRSGLSSQSKFFIVGPCTSTLRMIKERGYSLAETEEDADIVIWTGGEDISPFLYGQKQMLKTHPHPARDLQEVDYFKRLSCETPKVGICRGAQLLNVLSGGSMYQDVNNHGGRVHDIMDFVSQRVLKVNSIHHQMMIPSNGAFLIAGAKEATKKENTHGAVSYTSAGRAQSWDDVEACYYEHSNSLCVQWHPEYHKNTDEGREYFFDLIDKYCFT